MADKLCPFCKRSVKNHHPQCNYSSFPDPKEIKDREDRKKVLDFEKLKNSKSALEK